MATKLLRLVSDKKKALDGHVTGLYADGHALVYEYRHAF